MIFEFSGRHLVNRAPWGGWFLVSMCLMLSHCASGPPPAPGDSAYHGKETRNYRNGYHHGFMDGSKKLEPSFERYHDEYPLAMSEIFSKGYQNGYEAGRHNAPATPADEERGYQNGYEAGQADAQNGTQPDPMRYRSQFSAGSEAAFREGYAKGYQDGRRE
jgi:hypothetical protein